MSSVSAAQQQLQALLASVSENPPASYKGRLITQFVLCGLLALQSATWLFLTIRDCSRRGRKARPIRLQSVTGGKIVVFDCMFLFVLLAGISGFICIAAREGAYQHYYGNGRPIRNQVAYNFCSELPMVTAALIFSFSNLAGSISVRRQQAGQTSFSAPLVWAYNISLGLCLAVSWGVILPLTMVCNTRLNKVMVIRDKVYALLSQAVETIATTPHDPSLASVVPTLSKLKVDAAVGIHQFRHLFSVVVVLSTGVTGLCVIICLASLSFVLLLREQSQSKNSSIAEAFQTFSRYTRSGSDDTVIGDAQIPKHAGIGSSPSRNIALSETQAEGLALARLASNLTVAVPCILLFCAVVTVYLFLVYYKIEEKGWAMQEKLKDMYSWSNLLTNNFILACFLYNHYSSYRRGLIKQSSSSRGMSSSGFSGRSHDWPSSPRSPGFMKAQRRGLEGQAAASDMELAVHIRLEQHIETDYPIPKREQENA